MSFSINITTRSPSLDNSSNDSSESDDQICAFSFKRDTSQKEGSFVETIQPEFHVNKKALVSQLSIFIEMFQEEMIGDEIENKAKLLTLLRAYRPRNYSREDFVQIVELVTYLEYDSIRSTIKNTDIAWSAFFSDYFELCQEDGDSKPKIN